MKGIPIGLEAASRDHTLVGPFWEEFRESRSCSRDTYPESYITKYTIIRRLKMFTFCAEAGNLRVAKAEVEREDAVLVQG